MSTSSDKTSEKNTENTINTLSTQILFNIVQLMYPDAVSTIDPASDMEHYNNGEHLPPDIELVFNGRFARGCCDMPNKYYLNLARMSAYNQVFMKFIGTQITRDVQTHNQFLNDVINIFIKGLQATSNDSDFEASSGEEDVEEAEASSGEEEAEADIHVGKYEDEKLQKLDELNVDSDVIKPEEPKKPAESKNVVEDTAAEEGDPPIQTNKSSPQKTPQQKPSSKVTPSKGMPSKATPPKVNKSKKAIVEESESEAEEQELSIGVSTEDADESEAPEEVESEASEKSDESSEESNAEVSASESSDESEVDEDDSDEESEVLKTADELEDLANDDDLEYLVRFEQLTAQLNLAKEKGNAAISKKIRSLLKQLNEQESKNRTPSNGRGRGAAKSKIAPSSRGRGRGKAKA